MKQIFHPYTEWEDFKNGMWRKVSKIEEERMLPIAIEFTGDHEKYGAAMMEVIKSWVKSCQHNLTDENINQQAWIGHAACCFKLGLPEYIVRAAWGYLTKEQQDKANQMADRAIFQWKAQQKNISLQLF